MSKYHHASVHTAGNLRLIVEFINHEFTWSWTPEGEAYWIAVSGKINQLAEEARALQLTGTGRKLTIGEVSDVITSSGTVKIILPKTTHIFDAGKALCGMAGKPSEWPKEHDRVSLNEKQHSNCLACILEAETNARVLVKKTT